MPFSADSHPINSLERACQQTQLKFYCSTSNSSGIPHKSVKQALKRGFPFNPTRPPVRPQPAENFSVAYYSVEALWTHRGCSGLPLSLKRLCLYRNYSSLATNYSIAGLNNTAKVPSIFLCPE
jgi:hypothetical protein